MRGGGAINLREYIQIRLTDSLKINKKYWVSFYVSLSNKAPFGCSDIGAYLSVDQISSSNQEVLPYQPQVQNDGLINPISDTANWIKICDTITSQGSEQYLTIGNFEIDSNSDVFSTNVSSQWIGEYAYYHVDDVNVNCIDCDLNVNDLLKNKVEILPNPFYSDLHLKIDNVLLNSNYAIYDVFGQEVIKGRLSDTQTIINCDHLARGIYLIAFSAPHILINKLIIKS